MDLRKSVRIALFGPVSAGKSTLLNGLFCEQFSDMKIKIKENLIFRKSERGMLQKI